MRRMAVDQLLLFQLLALQQWKSTESLRRMGCSSAKLGGCFLYCFFFCLRYLTKQEKQWSSDLVQLGLSAPVTGKPAEVELNCFS